jgi:hypothetical protein
MLKEISSNHHTELNRRWFSDDYFDLVVWLGDDAEISGFQLCYDKPIHERALTWTTVDGYSHERVDEGEENPAKNRTPILVRDGLFAMQEVLDRFVAASDGIDVPIRAFIVEKIRDYR